MYYFLYSIVIRMVVDILKLLRLEVISLYDRFSKLLSIYSDAWRYQFRGRDTISFSEHLSLQKMNSKEFKFNEIIFGCFHMQSKITSRGLCNIYKPVAFLILKFVPQLLVLNKQNRCRHN